MAPRVDAGIGDPSAEVGTAEWAQRFRLSWLSVKHDLRDAPERFVRYFRKGLEHRVWTLLHDEHGKMFETFDEFCRAPEPWGFGQPWSELRPFLVGVCTEKELELATFSEAQGGPGRGHKGEKKYHDDTSFSQAVERRVRAIGSRAPESIRDLYRQDRVGQVEAAKLGPKNPTPEKAAEVTEVARKASALAKSMKADPPRLVKQAVNKLIREELGIEQSPADRLRGAIDRLLRIADDDERERIRGVLRDALEAM